MEKDLEENLEFVWGEEFAEGTKESEAIKELRRLIEHKPSVGFEEEYMRTVADAYTHYLEMKYQYIDTEDSEYEAKFVIDIVRGYFVGKITEEVL